MRKALVLGVLSSASLVARAQEISIARAAAQHRHGDPVDHRRLRRRRPGRSDTVLPKTEVDRNKLLDEAIKRAARREEARLLVHPADRRRADVPARAPRRLHARDGVHEPAARPT